MKKFDIYKHDFPYLEWEHVKDRGKARVFVYRRGSVCKFESMYEDGQQPGAKRDKVQDQSRASRHRAAFCLGNAECDWLAMVLLTWRVIPPRVMVKKALRRLTERWHSRWGEGLDAWILEMQQRGAPHYHLFVSTNSNFGLACANAPKEQLTRENGKTATVVRGGPDFWLRDAWLDCIGADDVESRRFNARGIIELMHSPDAAGRYAAKEAAKREQKLLPEIYQEGLGRRKSHTAFRVLNPSFFAARCPCVCGPGGRPRRPEGFRIFCARRSTRIQ